MPRLAFRRRPYSTTLVPGAIVSTLVQVLIAFFLPPISVLMTHGFGIQFLFNILLCLLFYLPGSLHALYLLLSDR